MKILLSSLFLLSVCPLLANIPEIAGPISGDVRANQVTLWMYAPPKSKCTFSYRAEGSSKKNNKMGKLTALSNQAAKVPGQIFKSTMNGLSPNTRYQYQISIDGQADTNWKGSFKTAPVEGTPTAFRLAITSCMKIGKPQGSWNTLLEEQPDLHLTVGDTHYADTTNPTVQLEHHVTYRREKEFAKVLQQVPTYAIWDDHDFGPNDSDGTAKGKSSP